MLISVHVLVLNSRRPWLRWASVSRKNGASSFEYCGCVGIGWARMEIVTFGPGPSVDCERPGLATTPTRRTARTPIAIRRMRRLLRVGAELPEWWSASLCFAVGDVNGGPARLSVLTTGGARSDSAGEERSARGHIMMLSRRQFLRTSAVIVGATAAPTLAISGRARAAGKELIPRKLPFPPNDEYGSYEPTITADGNTIYFARFAGTGDKRVAGTTTDIFVTHRVRQSSEWPGTGADWTVPERLPDTVNSESMGHGTRISPDGKTLTFITRRPGGPGGADIYVSRKQPNGGRTKAQALEPSRNPPAR